jgi:hypothetical protein
MVSERSALFIYEIANMRIRHPRLDARAPAALMSTGQGSGRLSPGNATATMGQKTRE